MLLSMRGADQNLANPSGLLLEAVLMLQHIGQNDVASRIHNGWLRTLEEGIHTYDIFLEGTSKQKVGTKEFTRAIISNLGKLPETLPAVTYKDVPKLHIATKPVIPQTKQLVGVDIFIHWNQGTPDLLGKSVERIQSSSLRLQVITNRGVKVYPDGFSETFCTDHWRCRFMTVEGETIQSEQIIEIYNNFITAGFDCIKTENLYTFDGVPGFSSVH